MACPRHSHRGSAHRFAPMAFGRPSTDQASHRSSASPSSRCLIASHLAPCMCGWALGKTHHALRAGQRARRSCARVTLAQVCTRAAPPLNASEEYDVLRTLQSHGLDVEHALEWLGRHREWVAAVTPRQLRYHLSPGTRVQVIQFRVAAATGQRCRAHAAVSAPSQVASGMARFMGLSKARTASNAALRVASA